MDKKANIKTDYVTFRWQKVCISEGSMLEGFLSQSVWQGFVSMAAWGRAADSQTWFPPTQPSKHPHTYSTSCLIALESNGSGPHVHTVDTTSITRVLHHEAAAVVYGNVFWQLRLPEGGSFYRITSLTELWDPKIKTQQQDGASEKKRSQLWWGENQLPDHRRQLKTIRAGFTQSGSGEAVRGRSQSRSSQRTPLLASASRSVHPDCKTACAKDSWLAWVDSSK